MSVRRASPCLGDVVLLTSNAQKRAEYQRLATGLRVEAGPDLAEVQGPPDAIIVYKALAAGEGRLVEDSILWIDGVPVVDVKWKIAELLAGAVEPGARLVWEVRLGVQHKGRVYAYLGRTTGVLCVRDGAGFGVDPVFWLPETGCSLAELDRRGTKDPYSARHHAAQRFLAKAPEFVVSVSAVPAWEGGYQRGE